MKITYLGTAACEGIPSIFCVCPACKEAAELKGKNIRTRSQVVIDDELLIDFPPDTYAHMIFGKLNLNAVDHIIITHTHEDHLYLEDIMGRREGLSNFDRNKILNVYGNDKLIHKLEPFREDEDYFRFTSVEKYCHFNEVFEFVPFEAGSFTVTPLLADHDKNEKCFIFLVEKEGKTFLYGNDTGYFPDKTWAYLKNKHIDFASLDCTHAMDENRHNHMGLSTCIEVKQRMLDEGIADETTKFIVNHFSHNSAPLHDVMCEETAKYGFEVSYDGLEKEI